MLGSKVEFHHDVWVQHSVKFSKNKLRTIQPQHFGKIKNSQSEPQCYWFLQKMSVHNSICISFKNCSNYLIEKDLLHFHTSEHIVTQPDKLRS